MMKRVLGSLLALSLLGSSAAMAQPYGYSGGYNGYDRGYSRQDNGGALIAGLGLFALGAILATQNHSYGYRGSYGGHWNQGWDHDRDHYRGYDRGHR